MGRSATTRFAGARARLPPHRHRAALRQRGERRPRTAGQRRAAGGGLHHPKFDSAREDAEVEAQRSLERLGVEHLDLYIIHWPQGEPTRAWPGMERAHQRGYARSIGVSNYSVSELDELMSVAEAPPVVNQVEFSPFKYRRKLLEACQERQVTLEAYSPLGTGAHLSDESVRQVAERVGRTPAQVLLRWCVQRNLPVITKSTHRDRIEENAQIFDFALSDEEMAALDALDETGDTERAVERSWRSRARSMMKSVKSLPSAPHG
jgi:diketogulonate reductase-like aldo/keto reductase